MAALLYKVRTVWRHPAGALSVAASAALLCGGAAFAGNMLPHVHAQVTNPLYTVGSLEGMVTATSTFAAHHLYVYRAEDKKLVAVLRADRYGHFGTTLVPGHYTVTPRLLLEESTAQHNYVATAILQGTTTAIVVDTRDY